jgi:hypothetical protein
MQTVSKGWNCRANIVSFCHFNQHNNDIYLDILEGDRGLGWVGLREWAKVQ